MDNYEDMTTSKKSKTKEVEENKKTRCAKWDDYAHIKFVELYKEEIRKGNRHGSYLSKDGWRNLIAVFNQMTGRNYDKKQMKNHWDTMKSEWKLYKSSTHGETGLGFDVARNTIRLDDEWWEKKITQDNRARAPSQTNLMHDDINEGEEGYEVEDLDIEEIDKSDDSQFNIQNIRCLDDTFTSDESLFPPTFNVNEKERPRWEGAAHDNRIFGETQRNQNLNFPYPLGYKYYLVDAGYRNKTRCLAPYKWENIRYHLEDFRHARTRQLRQPRDMSYYPINVQTEIVLATIAIHNYIRQRGVADNGFEFAQNETYLPSNTISIPCDTNMEVENEDDD
ncbi:Myb/SANT-like domain [Dillenia turbinata]|uniref:Myb/SANT-like domain n=1 Tax=Dillenia turbinata TaxID=194707 RepID=A0AAN8Z0P3_9MAGN